MKRKLREVSLRLALVSSLALGIGVVEAVVVQAPASASTVYASTVYWGATSAQCTPNGQLCTATQSWEQVSNGNIQAGVDGWAYFGGTTRGRQPLTGVRGAKVWLQRQVGSRTTTLASLTGGDCTNNCPTTYRITTKWVPRVAGGTYRSAGYTATLHWTLYFGGWMFPVYPLSDWRVVQ